jgi:class 3 adenylate cyclase
MRVGINTGEVIAVAEARPGEALATGDAVNAAARLEQAARPGQVLVSERTTQAARGFRAPSSYSPSSPLQKARSTAGSSSSAGNASSSS